MSDRQHVDEPDMSRRRIFQAAGAAIGGLAASVTLGSPMAAQGPRSIGAAARNSGSLGARLQGVQHFGLTVQNMDRAFAFYTEVLGGTEIMRDGDFQGERIHNTLLTDQDIEARGSTGESADHGNPRSERWRAASGRAVHPVRQRGDRTAAVPRR